ncbi:MAG TPA: hypothetical protein VJJ23_00525 [Candidatus Nanoarchaeia archaeon]|nr:hypothetical protein [Candidatus Nanoarchaeia archaeon]
MSVDYKLYFEFAEDYKIITDKIIGNLVEDFFIQRIFWSNDNMEITLGDITYNNNVISETIEKFRTMFNGKFRDLTFEFRPKKESLIGFIYLRFEYRKKLSSMYFTYAFIENNPKKLLDTLELVCKHIKPKTIFDPNNIPITDFPKNFEQLKKHCKENELIFYYNNGNKIDLTDEVKKIIKKYSKNES